MTKKYNRKGSSNQNAPTETFLSEEVRSGDNSKGNKRKKSQNDKTDLAE